jgi:hypothetical protein
MINVNVNSEISIKFNSDINTSTIIGNFTILNDIEMSYVNSESLKEYSKFSQVQGNVSYRDKIITFKPTEAFKKDTRYLVCIKANGLKDILGNAMLVDYVGMFYTESTASLPGCNFITPLFGAILKEVPRFTWTDQHAKCYAFQISKEPSFEVLLCDALIKNTTAEADAEPFYDSTMSLVEGLYYARVRAINGSFGEVLQIFIKDTTEALVSIEDSIENIPFTDYSEELEVLDMFPHENSCNMDTKVNIFYLKVKGLILAQNINFGDCFVIGDLLDEDEADTIEPHGKLDGAWNVIYDVTEDITYIIFTPIELGGNV